ncbi:MAG: protein-glutamate O-methyltransferase CheR [Sediminimonas qiaohouensis]|uniref:Chemotaxis protein methyltransferase n=1 Tax=Sediminimonas qiaohouensis TaxID=552061 RepID=A0A7C9HDC6_9RHOB|nr:protein-glutamate O-methyltransferase CheR [Sediminimonas qiaohouensis]MTJ06045.1 protein-glutamate O-methyltransferase CheR [Sediminimonas qiaohouensis]
MTEILQDDASSLISPQDFATVAKLLKQMAGIHLNPNKRAMVSGRLNKRLKALGHGTIKSYCAALEMDANSHERDAFVSALTTNMTRFNREAHHFAHLTQNILPELVKSARAGGRVRVWSTGCSTGEEAYDLAIRVLEACPDAAKLNLRILATDIDKTALATAEAGLYPVSSLSQFPGERVDQFFDQKNTPNGMAQVRQTAKDLIAFRWLNLNSNWPFHGKFDVIMCRNVAIYFDTETQGRLWSRLTDRLQPEGVLYVGHSEALPEEVMARVRIDGAGTFRLSSGSSETHRNNGDPR